MKNKSLYIAPLQRSAGSIVVTMGIMQLLRSQVARIAFFRPVIESSETIDSDIELILTHYALDISYDDCFGYTLDEAEKLVAEGQFDLVLETLVEQFTDLAHSYDFVLVQGLSVTSFSSSLDFNLNLEVAKNFGAPILSVHSGKEVEHRDMIEILKLTNRTILEEGCLHYGAFVNRLTMEYSAKLHDEVAALKIPVFCIPEDPELDKPTIEEIARSLGAKQILGGVEDQNRVVSQSKIAAMSVEHFLEQMQDGDLVITPGDRADIILGTLASTYSPNYPNAAGIVLTGGFAPSEQVLGIINSLRYFPIPVLSHSEDTITTTAKVLATQAKITATNSRKAALALGVFDTHVDRESILALFDLERPGSVTPTMFKHRLFDKAREKVQHILLPESEDERVLRATEILLRRGVVEITLLGKREKIEQRSASLGLNLEGVRVVDPEDRRLREEFAQTFYRLRKEKGLTLEVARDTMQHLNYFATMMVYSGYADGMVSGATHTTQETIRPAMQTIRTRPGVSLVSSLFFMLLDTKTLVYADCAVNTNPDAKALAEIAIASAETAQQFGMIPRIAMLSYSTGVSGKGVDVEKVRLATERIRASHPDLKVEGPIQYDAAVDAAVAAQKLPGSEVAGHANVFIFPDLNTGNNTYKAVQRSSGAIAIGPILQGLNQPVNDLSRGALVEDIVNTVVITAIQAQGEK